MKSPIDISEVTKDLEGNTDRVKHSKERALELSINQGAAANFSASLGASYITPFALALNATAFQVGLLSSFSGIISPIAQLLGAKSMENYSRKGISVLFVFLEALIWLPLISLAYLFSKGLYLPYLPYLLILNYSLIIGLGAFLVPAWFSWMGDLVPEKDRGKYFAIRNRATGTVGLAGIAIGAFILDTFKTQGLALLGFCTIFAIVFTFRIISFLILRKQYAPRFKLERGYYFSFWSFIKRYDNFGKFSVYKAVFHFSLMIASPFFAVYMLEDLSFSYVTFMAVTFSGSLFYLAFTPLAGKFSDKFGNLKLMYLGNFLFAITPALWIFFKAPVALIFIPQLLSGIGNAAIVLSFSNFTYDSVSPQRRGICVAYGALLIGIGTFLGSLLGGFLLRFETIYMVKSIFFVFGLSAALRFLSGLYFLPKIKEVKKVKRLPPVHFNIAHPFRTIHAETAWFKSVFK